MSGFDISWSFAAFKKVGKDFPITHKLILEEVGELANQANGWFFHMIEIEGGWLMCNGTPENDRWRIAVREAQYTDSQIPEAIDSTDNKRFTTYEAIQAEIKAQKKLSLLKTLLSKVGFPLSRE